MYSKLHENPFVLISGQLVQLFYKAIINITMRLGN